MFKKIKKYFKSSADDNWQFTKKKSWKYSVEQK